eukprot:3939170-Rhodomonas_salina.3
MMMRPRAASHREFPDLADLGVPGYPGTRQEFRPTQSLHAVSKHGPRTLRPSQREKHAFESQHRKCVSARRAPTVTAPPFVRTAAVSTKAKTSSNLLGTYPGYDTKIFKVEIAS